MTLQQLKYLIEVAETGSITTAAQRLFISQPSLSKSIAELEKEMGITIFNRSNRGVYLSQEGTRFLSYARQIVEQASLLESEYKLAPPPSRAPPPMIRAFPHAGRFPRQPAAPPASIADTTHKPPTTQLWTSLKLSSRRVSSR